MVGMAEIALDKETGSVEILDYVAICRLWYCRKYNLATVPRLRSCTECRYSIIRKYYLFTKGGLTENNFMTYKILQDLIWVIYVFILKAVMKDRSHLVQSLLVDVSSIHQPPALCAAFTVHVVRGVEVL